MAPPYSFGKGPIARGLEVYLRDFDQSTTLLKNIRGIRWPKVLDYSDETQIQKMLDLVRSFEFTKRLAEYDANVELAPGEVDQVTHLIEETLGPGIPSTTPMPAVNIKLAWQRARVMIDGLKTAITTAQDLAGDGVSIWPIEVFWGCGAGDPEAWITWSKGTGSESGHVTAVFLSQRRQTRDGMAQLKEEPINVKKDIGLYVCRQAPDGSGTTGLYMADPERGILTDAKLDSIFSPR